MVPAEAQRALLTFQLANRIAAFPLPSVERVTPMPLLLQPPGLPSLLEGILNLGNEAVPVLRLARLLQLPAREPGLYSMLVVLKGAPGSRVALLVDRVSDVLSIPESAPVAAGAGDSFNGCCESTVSVRGQTVHILSPERILLEKERTLLADLQAVEQERLRAWEPVAV